MPGSVVRVLITGDSAGYIKATQDAAVASNIAADEMTGRINKMTAESGGLLGRLSNTMGNVFGPNNPASKGLDKMAAKFDEADTHSQKFGQAMSTIGGATLLGAGAAFIAVGAESVKMADKFEVAHANMVAAMEAAHQPYAKWQNDIAETEHKMEGLGFTNTEVEQSLAKSEVSTQNMGESLKLETLAADYARMKHVDLATATTSLDRALIGNTRSLTQLGISLPVVATNALKLKTAHDNLGAATLGMNLILEATPGAANAASKAHASYQAAVDKVLVDTTKLKDQEGARNQILDALTQRLGGQASEYTKTFGGRLEVLKAQGEDLGKNLGMFLIPKIEELAKVMSDVIGWFEKNKVAAEILGGVIVGVLGAAVIKFSVETAGKFLTSVGDMGKSLYGMIAPTQASSAEIEASSVRFQTAMDAEVASVEATSASVEGGLDAMGSTAVESAAVTDGAIGSTGIGAILIGLGIAVTLLLTHWKQVWGDIKNWAVDAWHFLDDVIHSKIGQIILAPIAPLILLATHWHTVWDDIKGVMSAVWDFLKKIFDDITHAISDVMGPLSTVVNIASKVGGGALSFVTGGLFKAGGGSVSGGQPYIVGESGPELFVPNVSGVVIPNGANGTIAPPGAGSGGQGGGGSATIILQMANGVQLAQALIPDIRAVLYQTSRAVGPLRFG